MENNNGTEKGKPQSGTVQRIEGDVHNRLVLERLNKIGKMVESYFSLMPVASCDSTLTILTMYRCRNYIEWYFNVKVTASECERERERESD